MVADLSGLAFDVDTISNHSFATLEKGVRASVVFRVMLDEVASPEL